MLTRTLLIIKPDAVERNLIGEIIRRVEEKGFRIVAIKKFQMTQKEAENFYKVHKEKPFYHELVEYMTSGSCLPIVVEGKNAVQGIRKLIGHTDPKKAKPGTIRRDFAKTIRMNSVHASDCEKSAHEEIGFFFSNQKGLM